MNVRSFEVALPPVRFWITEAGSGTPLLLIHGLSGSSSWWRHNLERLSESHRVLAIDLVGFGRNRRFRNSPLPLSIEEFSGIVVRFIEESVGERVHLVGHSMGGQISIHVAANRGDLLRSLTLVSSTGVPFRVDPRPHIRQIRPPHPEQLRFSPTLALDALRAGPTSIAIASAYFLLNDARPLLDLIQTPTLLLWGDHDPLVPLSYGEAMQQRIAGSRLAILRDSGHVPMWDNPEAFDNELLRFLATVDATDQEPEAAPPRRFNWAIAGQREGVVYRSTGRVPTHILIHGLGVGTEYFRPLARALHERGCVVAAPELPDGFDSSVDAIVAKQGSALVRWLETFGRDQFVLVGHSTGCEVVRWIRKEHPELVERIVFLSPVWHQRRHPWLSLVTALMRDAVRERSVLLGRAIYSYWNHGLYVIVRQAIAYLHAAQGLPQLSADDVIAVGSDDPLTDWELLRNVPSAIVIADAPHAVHDEAPTETAAAILEATG